VPAAIRHRSGTLSWPGSGVPDRRFADHRLLAFMGTDLPEPDFTGLCWWYGDFATAIQNAVSVNFLIADDVDGTMVEAARFIVLTLGLSPDQAVS
jgi:hypothetical protein